MLKTKIELIELNPVMKIEIACNSACNSASVIACNSATLSSTQEQIVSKQQNQLLHSSWLSEQHGNKNN